MKIDAATAWSMHGHHHVTSACCSALYSLWQLPLRSGHDCHQMLTSWGWFLELGKFSLRRNADFWHVQAN